MASFTGNPGDQSTGCVVVGILSKVDVGGVTLYTPRRNLTGVCGVSIDIAGTIDPAIGGRQVRTIVLVELFAVPVEIRFAHL